MTETRVGLSLTGAAVVAAFALMLANAHTHTHTEAISELIHKKGIWAVEELSLPHRRTHTHTERLSPHWLTSLHPTAGVSEGSAAALCSRGLETLEWAFFFPPLLLFLGCISKIMSLPHFPQLFNILVPSVQGLCSLPGFSADRNSSKACCSQRQYDTTETTRESVQWASEKGRINRASTAGPRGSNPVLSQPCRLKPQLKEFGKDPSCSPSPIQKDITSLLSSNWGFKEQSFVILGQVRGFYSTFLVCCWNQTDLHCCLYVISNTIYIVFKSQRHVPWQKKSKTLWISSNLSKVTHNKGYFEPLYHSFGRILQKKKRTGNNIRVLIISA